MKKVFGLLLVSICFFACNDKSEKGKFTLHGELKNIDDQKVYLEQVFFSETAPQVLDTGDIKNGKFEVSAIGNEEGLYQLRFEKQESGYFFINDQPEISFKADVKDFSLESADFNTPANRSLKSFLNNIDKRQVALNGLTTQIDSLEKSKNNDSLTKVKIVEINTSAKEMEDFILKSIDSTSDPVIAMFAMGLTKGMDTAILNPHVNALAKRFPSHNGITGLVSLYNKSLAGSATPAAAGAETGGKAAIGSQAPEITMADTSGKSFSLSSLKGKYVLIDFWASWCGPCRGENPNVVANYNKYKSKNFTVLGVSLDENKAEWVKAINKDHLTWTHISDLKGWYTAAISSYGFDAIPYNVLIDPQGKIIATSLREEALGKKLEEVLK